MNIEIKKDVYIQMYRCIYGGVHWKPFLYITPEYKEVGWLLWVISYDDTR